MDFAPQAFILTQNLAHLLTGLGLSLFILLWMMDFVGNAILLRIKNFEEAAKVLLMLVIGVGLVRGSFFILIYLFEGMQFVLSAVNHLASPGEIGGNLGILIFVEESREFVNGLRGTTEILLVFLLIVFFVFTAFGAMISILLVPIAIFLELFVYSAFAPLPMATLATSQKQIGIQFLKNYASVCIRGAVVIFCLLLAQAFLSTDIFNLGDNFALEGLGFVFFFVMQMFLNLMILHTSIKSAEKFSRTITGS